ncbi:hypothetical protein IB277_28580 [Ensifer sp. ENS07]|jgi:hypothetical protein|uniref:Lipoprotein n=1 Tax=Ensifer adhaerens TaxID=106592 RepID=A0A9Q9DCL8_ENSAD|nr:MULTISPECIES: hypothetical protein [Ensifer]KSV73043.1 hypothetical protein N185_21185 [Sinorhizobium sp. GW3]KSV75702.1 hypothetical protein N182_25820 [Sinorhizobium sp. GL2]OWZ95598.1 hypothetical protein B9J07_01885 [Sinorhizobium sp. LM21]KQX57195.1 hypothetical protein ASD49_23030 [Ensifer sp. Root1298]KQX92503.1 hypothetical protein ASD41_21730 [Ensifer sp. Root1312]
MLSIKGFCTLACFAATAALLAGCASDTMKTYIGQPVESVIIDYGPPTNVLDLGWNERAYQWRKISTNVVSGTSSGEIRDTRRGMRYEEYSTPGYVEEQECFYSFYARMQHGRWYITNFRQPKLECE